MQKKIIALAVAGLASGAAFAQTNVTISGLLDISYQNTSVNGGTTATTSGVTRNGLNSETSFVRFAGNEDLGNGLKAVWQVENGVSLDGRSDQGALQFGGRDTWLGLAGGFGTVRLGNQSTPVGAMAGAVMTTQSGRTGDMRNLITAGQTTGTACALDVNANAAAAVRIANAPVGAAQAVAGNETCGNGYSVNRRAPALTYVSPTFSGFTGSVYYELPEQKNGKAAGAANVDTHAPSVFSGTVVYANGPILAGIGYQRHKGLRTDSAMGAGMRDDLLDRVWAFGGSYDFGVAKVGIVHSRLNTENSSAVAAQTLDNNMRAWGVNVTAPIGAGEFQAGWARQRWTDNAAWSNNDTNQWTLAYKHNLSKRTSVTAVWSKINNDGQISHGYFINGNSFNNAAGSAASAPALGATVGGATSATAGQDPRMYGVGLTHSF